MPRISALPESRSKKSLLPNTNYNTTHDTQLQHQPSSHLIPVEQQSKSVYGLDEFNPFSIEMHRQDSGYESITPHEAQPQSTGSSRRRAHSTHSIHTGSRTRPPTRRATKSGSVNRLPKSSKYSTRSALVNSANPVTVTPSFYDYNGYHDSSPYSTRANEPTSYFHFPPPDPQTAGDDVVLPSSAAQLGSDANHTATANADVYQAPPQTTHYWTSDQTRRLEYAAIDAASRGFKGWMMRHMVPDCFVPKEKRRVTFDDDTGSVRRYRIELETEESAEKDCVSNMMRRGFKKGGPSWWS